MRHYIPLINALGRNVYSIHSSLYQLAYWQINARAEVSADALASPLRPAVCQSHMHCQIVWVIVDAIVLTATSVLILLSWHDLVARVVQSMNFVPFRYLFGAAEYLVDPAQVH